MRAAGRRLARARDDVLRRRGAKARGRRRQPQVPKAEVEMAKTLIENLSATFKPEKYDDKYRKELLDLIRAEGERTAAPGAGRRGGRGGRRPDGCIAGIRRANEEAAQDPREAQSFVARGHPEALRVQAQARSQEDAGALRRKKGKRRSRSSSSSVMTPAGCTTTSGSRRTARCQLGRAEGRPARARRSSTSPCTSRTTRSSTRPSPARSRRASTAPARSRSGTTAPTSCSRRRRTAASPSCSRAKSSRGRGHSCRRTSAVTRRTG